jgi:hypothetical protein
MGPGRIAKRSPDPFSISDFPFPNFFCNRKSLREKKRIPILTRHKRMAFLLPANDRERRDPPVTGTG